MMIHIQRLATLATFALLRSSVVAQGFRPKAPTGTPSVAPGTGVAQDADTMILTAPPFPTPVPTSVPTTIPTPVPTTTVPTTAVPTAIPTTAAPTSAFPTEAPSGSPSHIPSNRPSATPSAIPSSSPSEVPSSVPTEIASSSSVSTNTAKIGPTSSPTPVPTTASPTDTPTAEPTPVPSSLPSFAPTSGPTSSSTPVPTTASATDTPAATPSHVPTSLPSFAPTSGPGSSPTPFPTTASPSDNPSVKPTTAPTINPNALAGSLSTTASPSETPSAEPTTAPTTAPTIDPNSVAGFINNNPNFGNLTTAYRRAGFVEPLSSPGSFTVFAPLDTAFSVVPAVYMALFFENDSFIPHLRKLLLHNILPAKRLAADFVDATNATALSGENFLVLQNPLRVNGIPLAVADIKVSNGVVHIVDDVLAPSWVFSSLQSRIAEDAELSVLFSFMNIIGLNIGNLGEYTFLAPTNDAFLALPDETMATLTDVDNPSSVVGQFLLYHIIKGVHTLPDFLPSRLETFQGGVVTVSINPTRFNGVTVAEGDILANNGALHKINRVLFKENGVKGDTALDFVADNPNFSTLFGALQRSGFDAALTQPASLTFFAPNNQAFNKLPASLLSTLFFNDEFVPHLQDLLLYHILGSEVLSSGFVDGTAMNALNSEAVIMRTGPLAVNSNRLLAFGDVSNGVVHNIGGVLTPSWIFNSITDLVVSSSSLSTLSNLMVLGGVSLSGAGAYTLLAPTNTAFTAMGVQALQELTDPDKVDLRLAFLAKHVVLGVYTTFQLTAGLKLPNILGTGVTITSINTVLLDDVAFVVFSNALADNGVIHVIDTVLDPEA